VATSTEVVKRLADDWLDVEESIRVCAVVKARDKDCFRNAFCGMIVAEDAEWYVEGWATSGVIVAGHGWIERDDGTIIDPTPIYHEVCEGRVYYPGRRYHHEGILDLIDEADSCLPLDEHMRAECIPPDLVHIYLEATEDIYGPEAAAMMRGYYEQALNRDDHD